MTRIAILVSGRGSNMGALIRAAGAPGYPARVALVVSSDPDAPAMARAREAGVEAIPLSHKDFPDRESHERALHERLEAAGIELVCGAGWMRVLTPWFVERWRDRAINIHPSLLPSFPGLHTHRKCLESGALWHGCTVHAIRTEVDAGPILGQAAVPVLPGDDEESLAARVLAAEHSLYPAALAAYASGRLRIRGERVEREAGAPPPPGPHLNV